MLSFHAQNAKEYSTDARNVEHSDIYTSVNVASKDHNNLKSFLNYLILLNLRFIYIIKPFNQLFGLRVFRRQNNGRSSSYNKVNA